ncbi:putative acriflavine sensitivity control protein ACR-2 [Coleophoma crateriformis]|uniref:Putative acriflavine sensitivity control protein ACR-2 n=1 Tax=Coleophoma crateriformis TaxID=565419 RepID=A0A3D8QYZ5_9HELO|nr:putative acriflavine sensitivity control protein ACR-2 [Coleophoma crateriformis]
METITIPSPSAFLSSPILESPTKPPPPAPKRKPTPTKPAASISKKANGVVKPKQSKSRNGCITCKSKRLKCDETKPTCQQCHKRSVACGGYKKDFKWRPFEEATFSNKPAPAPPGKSKGGQEQHTPVHNHLLSSTDASDVSKPPDIKDGDSPSNSDASSSPRADEAIQKPFFSTGAPSPNTFSMPPDFPDPMFMHPPMLFDMNTPPYVRETGRPRFEADQVTSSLSSMFENTKTPPQGNSRPDFSGQSPRLIDLLLPGSELNARPGTFSANMPPMIDPALENHFPIMEMPPHDSLLDDDVEEIIREPQMFDTEIMMAMRPPMPNMATSSRSSTTSPQSTRDDPFNKLYRQPDVQAGSPEMLMLRFDKQTCGILSVKDGPTENPWRTLIWPLARDSPALYHAIASMTAFHTSKERPALRVDGMEHMRSSIRSLATGIDKMRTDTALATTLVLAFSESWDQHISTGIEHLRGAKILVNQALIKHNKRNLVGDDLARLKFLCNTWVYMDVIARLTSVDDDEYTDFDNLLAPLYYGNTTEIDPLMGCASTLFPLIGRAAMLCRRVCRTESNSIAVVSQANQIKESIEQWQPGTSFERPEDPTSEIQHALQTAEAYRYATLLYLHQAVPEIPSLTSAQLAKKVLVYLATVPLSSRLVIVQIYPLLAAGCEAWEKEDRQWVEERWQSMAQRMWIGNIDRCWEVIQEVWNRRDTVERQREQRQRDRASLRPGERMMHSESSKRKFEEEMALEGLGLEGVSFEDMLNCNMPMQISKRPRNSISGAPASAKKRVEPITEEMDPELTIRGRLHWVGVMKDWEWESKSFFSLQRSHVAKPITTKLALHNLN